MFNKLRFPRLIPAQTCKASVASRTPLQGSQTALGVELREEEFVSECPRILLSCDFLPKVTSSVCVDKVNYATVLREYLMPQLEVGECTCRMLPVVWRCRKENKKINVLNKSFRGYFVIVDRCVMTPTY